MTIGMKMRTTIVRIPLYIFLIACCIVILVPFIWMVSTSLKPYRENYTYPPTLLPKEIRPQNYVEAMTFLRHPVWLFARNSLIIVVPVVILDVFVNAVLAYAFARLRFRGKRVLFAMLLATMMLPSQITMIPMFIMYAKVNWTNTFMPMIFPAFFGWPYAVFLLRQFFATIPDELDDAARIDGCGILSILFRIHLPLAKPALGIIGIFSFTQMWNEFLRPLIYLREPDKWPLGLALRSFASSRGAAKIHWEYAMAMAIFTCLPSIILFFIAQRHYIQGIVITGVKG